MNVLILTTHFNAGGITRYVVNLSQGLKQRGNNVWVASCGGDWLDKLSASCIEHKTIPIKTKSIASIKIVLCFFALISFIIKNRIQIIHANTRVTQYLAFLLYTFMRVKYICSFHGYYKAHSIRRILKFEGLRAISVSGAVSSHIIQDLGVSAEKVRVVHNGVDIPAFSEHRRTKTDFKYKDDDIVLGVLGRISAEKGQFLAVETFALLSQTYKNIYLVTSAQGRLLGELRIFIQSLKLGDRVKMLNLNSETFLDIIDVLLVPSSKEGFGYAIIEAFCKGVCVVGFNVGGISEIIQDNKNGLLFYEYSVRSLKEVIERAIQDPALCTRLIEAGRHDVNNFSLEKMAERTEKVYKEVA